MVVIDATNLLLMLRPGTPVPAGPGGVSIDKPKERIEHLVQQLDKAKTKIIIPTPALSEALVRAGAAASQQIVEHLQKYSVFRIEPFDTRAAIEVAAMTRSALDSGKKRGGSEATWAKVKYDRQIVAIAKVCGATTIYSDDGDIRTLASGARINVVSLADLPLPPEKAQLDLELTGTADRIVGVTEDEIAEDQKRTEANPQG
jgi:predicted nucleic acid-binding protein